MKLCFKLFNYNDQIWEKYLFEHINDNDKKLIWKNDHKQTFIRCYKINKLKSFYRLDDNIITIYKHSILNPNSDQITSIPSELGQLINLQELNLGNNQITSISSEIQNMIDDGIIDL